MTTQPLRVCVISGGGALGVLIILREVEADGAPVNRDPEVFSRVNS